MVVCNHCVILISQFTLANACRTLRAHLSTAILRKIGSLEACEIRHMHDALFHTLKIDTFSNSQFMSQGLNVALK